MVHNKTQYPPLIFLLSSSVIDSVENWAHSLAQFMTTELLGQELLRVHFHSPHISRVCVTFSLSVKFWIKKKCDVCERLCPLLVCIHIMLVVPREKKMRGRYETSASSSPLNDCWNDRQEDTSSLEARGGNNSSNFLFTFPHSSESMGKLIFYLV